MIDEKNKISNSPNSETTTLKFRQFERGAVKFAVLADEITSIEDWRIPTPLPNAPDSVLGVVGIHGRMLTVLDLSRISGVSQGSANTENGEAQKLLLALRGDEQLALVVDAEREAIDVSDEISEIGSRDLITTVDHAGSSLHVLNPRQLFPSAIQGRERRRRRF